MNQETKKNPDEGENIDFWHHLRDTIILLGGRVDVANLLIKSMDLRIGELDLKVLRRYNAELITLAKDRLANLRTKRIRTNG